MGDVDWQALGRRLQACRGFRWMPGMLMWGPEDYRVCYVEAGILRASDGGDCGRWQDYLGELDDEFPDLRDPASVGCLVALVREAWGNDCAIFIGQGWHCVGTPAGDFEDATLVEDLVAALERAP